MTKLNLVTLFVSSLVIASAVGCATASTSVTSFKPEK